MRENTRTPQINVSRIPVGGGFAGLAFAIGSMVIFLSGIPELRYVLAGALIAGCGIGAIIHFVHHDTPGTPWIPTSLKK